VWCLLSCAVPLKPVESRPISAVCPLPGNLVDVYSQADITVRTTMLFLCLLALDRGPAPAPVCVFRRAYTHPLVGFRSRLMLFSFSFLLGTTHSAV
jgi:hypothetical protein